MIPSSALPPNTLTSRHSFMRLGMEVEGEKTLEEVYEEGKHLGKGSTAKVKSCHGIALSRPLKRNNIHFAVEKASAFSLVSKIVSPYLTTPKSITYSTTADDYFAADNLAGKDTLFAWSQKEENSGAFWPILDMAKGIKALHQAGIFHRDIKPENVTIVEEGKDPHAEICDFGFATLKNQKYSALRPFMLAALEKTNLAADYLVKREFELHLMVLWNLKQTIGTPKYMSPSIVGPKGEAYKASDDIYSFALTALYLVHGDKDSLEVALSPKKCESKAGYVAMRHENVKKFLEKGDLSRWDEKTLSIEFRKVLSDMIKNVDKKEPEQDMGVFLARLEKLGPENFLAPMKKPCFGGWLPQNGFFAFKFLGLSEK